MPEPTAAIVLAAGSGTRLKSNLPKVLHIAAGRPLLVHVLDALRALPLSARIVVASSRGDKMAATVAEFGAVDGLEFAVQDPPLGTADAVRVGLESVPEECETILVVPGDTPLLESDTLFRVLSVHSAAAAVATVLTARVTDPFGYGRIVRGLGEEIVGIVEEGDASVEERRIHEVNAGVYAFDRAALAASLGKVQAGNAQGEYYLTDVVGVLCETGSIVVGVETGPEEVGGVNNRSQLAYVSGLIRHRVSERLMAEGVSIVDPRTTYIDSTVIVERDVTIHPFTFLEGETRVEEGAEVGPQARVIDSEIGKEAVVSFAVVRASVVGPGATVGPFASLRPGSVLRRGAHLGTFVEIKNSTLGEGSKAPHLSYLGDAEIGAGVNVGAGSITCNWDGREKNRTVIEDDAYISSDTMLIAPVRIGKRAATGAGAVVRGDVPDDALAVGMPARVLPGKGDRMGRRSTKESDGDSAAAGDAPQ